MVLPVLLPVFAILTIFALFLEVTTFEEDLHFGKHSEIDEEQAEAKS